MSICCSSTYGRFQISKGMLGRWGRMNLSFDGPSGVDILDSTESEVFTCTRLDGVGCTYCTRLDGVGCTYLY